MNFVSLWPSITEKRLLQNKVIFPLGYKGLLALYNSGFGNYIRIYKHSP